MLRAVCIVAFAFLFLNILLKMHKRRLQLLEEQQALKGINTSPEILIEIETVKAKVDELAKKHLSSASG
jgi:hypothetical protein